MSSSPSKDGDSPSRSVSFLRSYFGKLQKNGENDKILDRKKKATHLKDDEKLEKRRLKEKEKLQKQQDKEKEKEQGQDRKLERRVSKLSLSAIESLRKRRALTSLSIAAKAPIESENDIPIFLHKCIQFIEEEGLDSEGIYRIPGNRAHVDLLFQKFEEDSNVDIKTLDVAVNAVATALKDFFSKRYPPLFEKEFIAELEEIVGIRNTSSACMNMDEKMGPCSRLLAFRNLLKKLPAVNFAILKFMFQHFVQVTGHSKLNSMDSRNLAICWWPTLIRIEFTNISRFELLRPYLEDFVETMIEQFPYFFYDNEPFVKT